MTDDDITRDGLPRFIYGEYTGEMRLPERPRDDEDRDTPPGRMDRQTMILLASGGLALVLIIGLVVAALRTGGGDTPAAANPQSPVASSPAAQPSPTQSPQPTSSWPIPSYPVEQGPASTATAKTTTAKPPVATRTTTPTFPKPPITVKPSRHR